MQFICYPKCTTCQKARKWLDEKGISYELRDIKADNPSKQELRDLHTKSGLPIKRFFNTSGLQYKSLGLKNRDGGKDQRPAFPCRLNHCIVLET